MSFIKDLPASLIKIVIPAKAGTHSSAAEPPEKWVPAFAGMTMNGAVAPAFSGPNSGVNHP
jgi:hypothetical protein